MTPWIRTNTVKKSERNPRGKTYIVLYRLGGRSYREQSAGSFNKHKEATARRDLVAVWLARGLDPKAELAKLARPEKRRTFREWAALWLASRVDLAESSVETHRRQLVTINRSLGDIDPLRFTPADAQEWIAERSELSPAMIRIYVSTIRLVFDYIDLDKNPWRSRSLRLPRVKREEVNPPTAAHVIAMIERVPVRAILPLAVLEQDGLRVGEVIGLTWGDFDEAGRRLRLRRESTKTRRARWVPLPEWLADAISETVPHEDRTPERRLFQGITDRGLRKWMSAACRDAGLPHCHPHELRHRRISLWHGQGITTKEVAARAGHAKASMTLDVYSHVMPLEEIPVETWVRLVARVTKRREEKVTPTTQEEQKC